jgi:hypothetical protein
MCFFWRREGGVRSHIPTPAQAKQSEVADLISSKREISLRIREVEQLLEQARAAKSARDEEFKAASIELAQLKVLRCSQPLRTPRLFQFEFSHI